MSNNNDHKQPTSLAEATKPPPAAAAAVVYDTSSPNRLDGGTSSETKNANDGGSGQHKAPENGQQASDVGENMRQENNEEATTLPQKGTIATIPDDSNNAAQEDPAVLDNGNVVLPGFMFVPGPDYNGCHRQLAILAYIQCRMSCPSRPGSHLRQWLASQIVVCPWSELLPVT